MMRTDAFKQHLLASATAMAVALAPAPVAGVSNTPAPIQTPCLPVEEKQRGKATTPCLLENDVIVVYRDLKKEGISYSRVHLRRLIALGLFPAPIMLSPNRMGWGRKTHLEPWKTSRPTVPIKPEPVPPAEAA